MGRQPGRPSEGRARRQLFFTKPLDDILQKAFKDNRQLARYVENLLWIDFKNSPKEWIKEAVTQTRREAELRPYFEELNAIRREREHAKEREEYNSLRVAQLKQKIAEKQKQYEEKAL